MPLQLNLINKRISQKHLRVLFWYNPIMKQEKEEYISWMMSRIRGKNNKLERKLRKALRSLDIRGYRVDDCCVLGKPDVCFRNLKLAVFVDGDFWHGYRWDINKANLTARNKTFWIAKIERNMERDRKVTYSLESSGWTVMRFWEHEINEDVNACAEAVFECLRILKLRKMFKPLNPRKGFVKMSHNHEKNPDCFSKIKHERKEVHK